MVPPFSSSLLLSEPSASSVGVAVHEEGEKEGGREG